MRDFTNGNIRKNYFLFALPLVLSGLLSQMTQTIDTVLAGKIIGTAGLAATGATGPFFSFISSIFWGFTTGVAAFNAKQFGAKDYEGIKRNLYSNYLLLGSFCVAVTVLSIVFYRPLFALLHIDPVIFDDARRYFIIYMIGFIAVIFVQVLINTLYALGISGFALVYSIIYTVCHIGGNLLTVAVLGWGTAGLAVSAVMSCVIADTAFILKLRACFKEMGVLKVRVKPCFDDVRSTFSYSVPSSLQQTSMYLASLVLSPMVNAIGATASASYTVMLNLYGILAGIYQNASKTLSNFVAQNLGAGKLDNIKKGVRMGLYVELLLVVPLLLATALFPQQICSIFFQKSYAGADLGYAILFARVFLPLILFNLIANLFHAYFRGTGTMKPLLVATVLGSVSRIAVTALCIGPLGMTGMMIGWASSWVVDGLFGLLVYWLNDWNVVLKNRM